MMLVHRRTFAGGAPRRRQALLRTIERAASIASRVRPVLVLPLPITDFIAFSPDHSYIHRATGEAWTSMAVNARVMPIEIGSDKKPLAANVWLDRNDAVEQRVWSPGEAQIIENRLVAEGGFFAKQALAS